MKPHPKPITHRDPKYRKFVGGLPCLICGEKAEFHHESGLGDSGGMSKKCSDYFGVPLCRMHHDERDRLGFKSFWGKYWKDPHSIVMFCLIEYAQQQDQGVNVKRMIIDFLIGEIIPN